MSYYRVTPLGDTFFPCQQYEKPEQFFLPKMLTEDKTMEGK